MKKYLILLALALGACHSGGDDASEAYDCTLFNTPAIPAAEDFPMYLYCVSDRGNVLFFWWHEVADKLGTLTPEQIDQYRLPEDWFDRDTGDFVPSAFWPVELGIIHQIDGIHNPCSIPELVEFAGLECVSPPGPPPGPPPLPPAPGVDDDDDPETDDLTEEEAWKIVNKYLYGPGQFKKNFKLLCKALKALNRQIDNPLVSFFLTSFCGC